MGVGRSSTPDTTMRLRSHPDLQPGPGRVSRYLHGGPIAKATCVSGDSLHFKQTAQGSELGLVRLKF